MLHYMEELRTALPVNPEAPSTSRFAIKLIKLAGELSYFIKLFDLILAEEYDPDNSTYHVLDGNMSLGSQRANLHLDEQHSLKPVCGYCSTDLFLGAFQCKNCSPSKSNIEIHPQGASSHEHGGGVLLCSFCYIEGRECACGAMDPVQFGSFAQLLLARNEAVNLVKRANPGTTLFEILQARYFRSLLFTFRKLKYSKYRNILRVNYPPAFHAANILRVWRRTANPFKVSSLL